jgi:hypothetical protein
LTYSPLAYGVEIRFLREPEWSTENIMRQIVGVLTRSEIIRFRTQHENATDRMLEHLVISRNEFDYRRAIKAQ